MTGTSQLVLVLLATSLALQLVGGSTLDAASGAQPEGLQDERDRIVLAKCCEEHEVLLDHACVPLAEANETEAWRPDFESEDGYPGAKPPRLPRYLFKYGPPRCRSNENQWDVYHYSSSSDTLVMLTSGKLRHYVPDQVDEIVKAKELYGTEFLEPEDVQAKAIHYDYPFGHYCADKAILTKDNLSAIYAKICVPRAVKWASTDNLIRKAVDPALHAIAVVCYLVVAIVYFVLPQLRDLVGNIVTSLMVCLIVNQCASFITIFTEFGNHINFLATDLVMFISLLAAFFWLNALGYYIWKTFRSKNVFLRSTDKKKYCCYATCVCGCTVAIAATAIFAHFTLEINKPIIGGVSFEAQETLGWLGLSVLFMTIAFSIFFNLYFILTTKNKLKRMRTYGRIHHKMKYNFRTFILVCMAMSIGWVFLMLSLSKYNGLVYCHIILNALQAFIILYVCVFGQKRVTFLLGKTCNCCISNENAEGMEWGEEMTAINAGY
ncbi:probable G-protein coupled receptor Mth-like 5 [Copidosoma floridanum]|uniref:probable G-protein coupled receptor Mth-like 5 n=1 Tax=Copidosoma floridanum TaxID=29053 RepID=UPI0006C93CCA|nr:probable G-protein coupled receptor Mth-like 5 [Copidosoma floridanum]